MLNPVRQIDTGEVGRELWAGVQKRLQAELGDEVYGSWFARLELETLEGGVAQLSVPTRFLKSWIDGHYAEHVLACLQAGDSSVASIDITVRSVVLRYATAPTLTSEVLDVVEEKECNPLCPAKPKPVTVEDIQRLMEKQYYVSRDRLSSRNRTPHVVQVRQMAMYLAKRLTLNSLPEIGRRFGGRDHTTVLHAVRKIEGLVGNDPHFAEEVEALKRQLLYV